jgi:hypothetical protein
MHPDGQSKDRLKFNCAGKALLFFTHTFSKELKFRFLAYRMSQRRKEYSKFIGFAKPLSDFAKEICVSQDLLSQGENLFSD